MQVAKVRTAVSNAGLVTFAGTIDQAVLVYLNMFMSVVDNVMTMPKGGFFNHPVFGQDHVNAPPLHKPARSAL